MTIFEMHLVWLNCVKEILRRDSLESSPFGISTPIVTKPAITSVDTVCTASKTLPWPCTDSYENVSLQVWSHRCQVFPPIWKIVNQARNERPSLVFIVVLSSLVLNIEDSGSKDWYTNLSFYLYSIALYFRCSKFLGTMFACGTLFILVSLVVSSTSSEDAVNVTSKTRSGKGNFLTFEIPFLL